MKNGRCAIPKDPEQWVVYDLERLRAQCGERFAFVPIDDLRLQACNFRKAGLLPKSRPGGHGASKPCPLSQELLDHYKSTDYIIKRDKILARTGFRCQICNDRAAECHHRTYDNLKTPEEEADLIAVCRKCHKVCDARRRRHA